MFSGVIRIRSQVGKDVLPSTVFYGMLKLKQDDIRPEKKNVAKSDGFDEYRCKKDSSGIRDCSFEFKSSYGVEVFSVIV